MSHNTGYEVPSNDILDFSDNCENLDVLMNADQEYWTDRLGNKRPTIDYALRMAGFTPAGFDFTTGGVLRNGDRNKCVFNQADQTWYSWSGDLPYNVIAGSTPEEGWKVVNNTQSTVLSDISGFNKKCPNKNHIVFISSYHGLDSVDVDQRVLTSGGMFKYLNIPRNLHNGGTIISPTVPATTPFTNETLVDFLKGYGETEGSSLGCWVKIGGELNITNFGGDPTGKLYIDKVFQHMVDKLYTTSSTGPVGTGTGVSIPFPPGVYKQEYPLVFNKDYIKILGSGKDETVLWKPENKIRTDLGTNIAPLRSDVGGVVDKYDVDAHIIYTHPDDGYRFGSVVKGIRLSGKSEDPTQSLLSYREYGIFAPRAAMVKHEDISATRVARLYYTFDTFKHTVNDLTTNYGGGVLFYVKDASGKVSAGTSLLANNCWASRPLTEAGLFLPAYEINGLEYSTLTSCSADNMFEPWRISNSNLDISSGSMELARSVSGMTISGGNVILRNFRSIAPTSTLVNQIEIKNNAKVKFTGGMLSGKKTPLSTDIGVLIKSGSEVIFEQFVFPGTGKKVGFDFSDPTPPKSITIIDDYGVPCLYNFSSPEGVFNVPIRSVSINDLNDKSHSVNILHKYRGRMVILAGNNKTVMASGNTPESIWVDLQGETISTPV